MKTNDTATKMGTQPSLAKTVERAVWRAFAYMVMLAICLSPTGALAFAEENEAVSGDSSDEGVTLEVDDAVLGDSSHENTALEEDGPALVASTDEDVTAEEMPLLESAPRAKRTIMLYVCGSDLEESSGMASISLRQILNADFGNGEDVRFIVMTGGSCRWFLEGDYLVFPDDVEVPEDAAETGNPNFGEEVVRHEPKSQISGPYNQIWEAKSTSSPEDPGKLVLLDGDGLANGRSDETSEWMSDPQTLKGFINYCVENCPAEKYDLILWDHGGGSTGGFALDFRRPQSGDADDMMSLACIIDALNDNAVTNRSDDDLSNDATFDFVDFDACLMASTEVTLGLADYTDYLVVSPETIPGRGQVYSGWLNELGNNSDAGTYELGRRLVDDFVEFYGQDHEGYVHQEGTMALINTNALMQSGFVGSLSAVGDIMRSQVESGQFYDELRSVKDSIRYSDTQFYDLGNLVSLLGMSLWEIEPDAANDSTIDYSSAYTQAANTLLGILSNPEIVYARNTPGIGKESRFFMGAEDTDNRLESSGLHLYFPLENNETSVIAYDEAMRQAIDVMPQGDGRVDFLRNYVQTLYEYNFVRLTGRAVTEMVNSGDDWTPIDYRKVQEYWKLPLYPEFVDIAPSYRDYTRYNSSVKPLLEAMGVSEDEVAIWLDGVVRQQALEAVSADNVSATSVVTTGGTATKVHIANTRRRAIDSIHMGAVAELPAVHAYIEQHDAKVDDPDYMIGELITRGIADLPLGSMRATMDGSMDSIEESSGDFLRDYVNWFNNATTTTWNIDPLPRKWYAVRDAGGNLHVAYNEDGSTSADIPVIRMRNGEVGDKPELNVLVFEDGKLTQVLLHDDDGSARVISANDLKTDLEYTTALYIDNAFGATILPASGSSFWLTPDNVGDIELVYTDASEIQDIADVSGDGDSFSFKYTVSDIYGTSIDISDRVNNPTDELIDIRLATVEHATYTGQELRPKVTCNGKTLVEGVDYTLDNDSGRPFVLPGEYDITLWGMGDYTDFLITTFVIDSDENETGEGVPATDNETEDGTGDPTSTDSPSGGKPSSAEQPGEEGASGSAESPEGAGKPGSTGTSGSAGTSGPMGTSRAAGTQGSAGTPSSTGTTSPPATPSSPVTTSSTSRGASPATALPHTGDSLWSSAVANAAIALVAGGVACGSAILRKSRG